MRLYKVLNASRLLNFALALGARPRPHILRDAGGRYECHYRIIPICHRQLPRRAIWEGPQRMRRPQVPRSPRIRRAQVRSRLDGMNEQGFMIGLHLVRTSPRLPGLSCVLIVRMILDQCASTGDAIAMLRALPHAMLYNYSLLDAKGVPQLWKQSRAVLRYEQVHG